LFAQVGYCELIGVIDNEKGGIRALLTNDVSSPHLSLGFRVSCVGAGNQWHEHHRHKHHGYDNRNEHHGNYRYHHGYDGHYHW